jgi:DNA-binding FrmR family transcriptional regulator
LKSNDAEKTAKRKDAVCLMKDNDGTKKSEVIEMRGKGDLTKVVAEMEKLGSISHHENEELARSHRELAESYVNETEDKTSEDSCGSGHGHGHEHGHEHGHTHSHQHTKQVINRLARAGGHLDKVKRMVEQGYDCTEVLIQLSAVIAALNRTGKVILEDHIQNCIVDAVKVGDEQAIEDLKNAIDRFLK